MNQVSPKSDVFNRNTNPATKSNSKVIIILSILLALLAIFAVQNYLKNKKYEANLLEEKHQIETNLNDKIRELDTALETNTVMEAELVEARKNLLIFKDSVTNLKTLNSKVIRRYKNMLADLEKTNKRLLKKTDSLQLLNYSLSVEVDSAQAKIVKQSETISKQIQSNDSLTTQNTTLTKIVNKGAEIKISNVGSIAMKERNNGKLVETNRARRTDAVRTAFLVRENNISEPGTKTAYIIIQKADGTVIDAKGSFNDTENNQLDYTDKTDFDYQNDDLEVITVSPIISDLTEGTYYIKIYVDGKLLGNTTIDLK